MKISTLIKSLDALKEKFGDGDVYIRRGHEKGYFSDHEIQVGVFYPDSGVRLMAGERPVYDTPERPGEND